MRIKIVPLRAHQPTERAPVCPAQYYKFTGEPTAISSEPFLEKAAAFQEIRDCLTAADYQQISARQAERRISYFVRVYLNTGQVG
jgi:hypothetical protein